MNVEIVVLKCQKCNECLNVHNFLGLLFKAVLKCPVSTIHIHPILNIVLRLKSGFKTVGPSTRRQLSL